jgi:hypothetical protein
MEAPDTTVAVAAALAVLANGVGVLAQRMKCFPLPPGTDHQHLEDANPRPAI